jgi:hypothetical protein
VSGTVAVSGTLPVSGPLTNTELRAAAVPVSGPLTDAQIRATALTVNVTGSTTITGTVTANGPLTDTQLRAAAVPVSGPITDAQLRATAVPVSAAALPLPTGASTEATLSAFNDKFGTSTTIPDNKTAGIAVRPVGQDTWVGSFSNVGASVLDSQFRAPDVGTGVGYSQAGGALLITTGTSTNAEFLTRSTESWRGTMQMRYSTVLSQRIANQNFAVLLADLVGENLSCTINSATSITVNLVAHGFTAQSVGQFIFVGGISGAAGVPGRYAIASIPSVDTINFTVAGWPATGSCTLDLFGHSHVKHIYNGTVATSMLADAQRRGWASGDSTLAINTTAALGHIVQAHLAGREVFWHDTLRATSTTPNMTSRGSRFENLPDDNLNLYLFFWSYNGTVAPATTTTWTISFASVEKFANFPIYLQGSEMQGTAAPAPVATVGTTTVAGTVTSTVTAGTVNPVVPATPYFVNSAATTNGALILTGTSGVSAFWATNTGATAAFVKLYNKATAPTVGTDVPEMIIPVPAAVSGVPGVAQIAMGFHAFRFALGLGIAITGAVADTDTTAVAVGQVKVKLSRTI